MEGAEMTMDDHARAEREVGSKAAQAIYRRTRRRGFLAKASALLIGASAAGVLAEPTPAAADAPSCCSGAGCKASGGSCPGVGACPSGWTYTGYTWTCCSGHYLLYCSDCRNDTTGLVCSCTYHTRSRCTGALTLTELSR
jgi:hypothetical protein